jgi:hypothetical protein
VRSALRLKTALLRLPASEVGRRSTGAAAVARSCGNAAMACLMQLLVCVALVISAWYVLVRRDVLLYGSLAATCAF